MVAPTIKLAEPTETVTVATGGAVTVIVANPLVPSLVAVMLAVPMPAAVTAPVEDTVATLTLSDDQVMVSPVRTWPPASRGVAVAVVAPPIETVGWASATESVAIAGGPVTPPPELQPAVVRQIKIAVRMRSSGAPRGLPRPAKGIGLNIGGEPGLHK